MEEQRPTVGRMVHFKESENAVCRAAVITIVDADQENIIDLTVFHPQARIGWARVGKEGGNVLETMAGSWHWPERV